MQRHRAWLGVAAATMAAVTVGCQLGPLTSLGGGQLAMDVHWPMRVQAIPPDTAVVAVGVFKDGQLVENGAFHVAIIGKGAGSVVYSGLANGSYRIVAAAFDKDLKPLAAGAGAGTVDTKVAIRGQVVLNLDTGAASAANELSTWYPDIQKYLGATPTPSPTDKPTDKPTDQPTTQPTSQPTAQPTSSPTDNPTPQATPTSTVANGGGGGGSLSQPISFTGGFQ